MIDLQDKLEQFKTLFNFGDASLELILMIGLGSTIFLLLLLKLSFVSMKKTDKKAYEALLEDDD
ncbi:MAG: hypothetical protein HWE30_14210 [Methylocystaceae bacterium]|nr:hypothetical protein [Methylocystaceae bacterium]